MPNYTGSRVLSIRIDPELLEAIREQAEAEGRSVSGEIVFLVREQIEARPGNREKPRPISGWLADRAGPDTHAQFRKARARASSRLLRGVQSKARRK
jgi:hypothetical protein